MRMTITAETKFTARHAVQLDPNFPHPHERVWTLAASVAGPIVGPGWIMRFEDLTALLAATIPQSGDLCELAAGGTSEAVARVIWAKVEQQLPDGVELVRLALTEAPARTVVIEA